VDGRAKIESMNAQDVLTTTRSVRKRLDFDRPVPRELLLECLEVAVQAPTGSNSQGWQFVIVTDAEKKRAIGEWYRESWYEYAKRRPQRYERDDLRREQLPRVASSAQYLADRMHEIPAMIIPCIEGRVDVPGASNLDMAGLYGSILPAAWSFMLAARDRGLVGAWTTLHLKYERETAELLGIPYERYTQAALITLGFSTGGEFKPAERIALENLVHWEQW
jgi:nitroreductase